MSSNDVSVVLVQGAWHDGSGARAGRPGRSRLSRRGDCGDTQRHLLAPNLAPDDHGLIYLTEVGTAFAQNAAADELAVLAGVQRPLSSASVTVGVAESPGPWWPSRTA
jgi:hypothetical protein